MRIACWIAKARNTRTEYLILSAFLWRQWLCERTSFLRYNTLPILVSAYGLTHYL
jgi:hypothetical protein